MKNEKEPSAARSFLKWGVILIVAFAIVNVAMSIFGLK